MDDASLGPNYAIIVDRRQALPELEARVELAPESAEQPETVAHRLQSKLQQTVRLRINVIVGDPGSVPRSELGKAKRVFDRTGDDDPLG